MADKWVAVAEWQLEALLVKMFPDSHFWYARAAVQSMNPRTKSYFEQMATSGLAEASLPLDQAKINLLKNLQDSKYGPTAAMDIFAEVFGTNNAAAARALAEFLPVMQAKFPQKRQLLEGAVVSEQANPNAPIVAEFQNTLDECVAHPNELSNPGDFWANMNSVLFPWCLDHDCLAMAQTIVDHEQTVRSGNTDYLKDNRLILAMEYFKHRQWQNALRLFECYSNRPVVLHTSILRNSHWAFYDGPVLTGRYAAVCRKNLGMSQVKSPRQFEPGKPCLNLDDASAFLADSDGLWIAGHAELRHLDFDLKTGKQIPLPIDKSAPCTCIKSDSSDVWIGTAGSGLLQIHKADLQCHRFTVNDGLLMDSLKRLHFNGHVLWIGYGQNDEGGLGYLDKTTLKFRSYMAAFHANDYDSHDAANSANNPPRYPVVGLATLANGDVLTLTSENGLQRFYAASNSWKSFSNPGGFPVHTIAVGSQHLVEGVSIAQLEVKIESQENQHSATTLTKTTVLSMSKEKLTAVRSILATNQFGQHNQIHIRNGITADKGGLEIRSLTNSRWISLCDANGIPNPPKTMTFAGENLWVGGMGYLACVDLKQLKVQKFGYLPGSARSIQINGGYVWAQFDQQLYRIPLDTLR
jgi:hypothetical protein